MIINPRSMDVMDWTAAMTLLLDKFGPIMVLQDPREWRDWAAQVVKMARLGDALLDPYEFDNWQDWAVRFSKNADLLLG